MNGLIYKEICMFKAQFKSWIFAFAILGVYGFIFKSTSILLMMTALFGIMSCLTTFTYDKTYRCDEFVAAMPLSRKKIVISKYVFLLILDLLLTLITCLTAGILSPIFNENLRSIIAGAVGVLYATMFLQAVVLPLIYTLGAEKARFAFILIGILPYMILVLFKDRLVGIDLRFVKNLMYAAPFVLVAVIAVSVWVSVRIYRKKDL